MKTKLKFTDEEMQEILQTFNELYGSGHDDIFTIDQDFIDYINVVEEDVPKFEPLIGYKLHIRTDGDHKNDGHLVDYEIKFISPEGNITEFETEMCLMVGWNYYTGEDNEIN